MSVRVGAWVGFAAALLLPAAAAGQQDWRIEIMPRVGVYSPQSELGTTAVAEGPWNLRLGRLEAVPAFELLAQVGLPGGRWAVRASALATTASKATGYFDCGPGFACPSVLLPSKAATTVLAGVLDLVVAPFERGGAVRPFALLGAGAKRYAYTWQDAVVLVPGGHDTETTLAVHAGVGVDVDLLGAPLRLEVADYWSPRGRSIGKLPPGTTDIDRSPGLTYLPRREAQHDLVIVLGYRLALF